MCRYNTSYSLAHQELPAEQLARPQHARVAVVRNTFYDKDWNAAFAGP